LVYSFYTDAVWNRIVYGDYYGNWIKAYGTLGAGIGGFDSPRGIAVDSFGNVYVADFNNGRIVKLHYNFSAKTLSCVQGFYAGTFMEHPIDLDIDNNGTPDNPDDDIIWVVDYSLDKILKFSSEGELLLRYGSHGSGAGQFDKPVSIAVGKLYGLPNGYIYVVDRGNNRVAKLISSGNTLSWLCSYSSPSPCILLGV